MNTGALLVVDTTVRRIVRLETSMCIYCDLSVWVQSSTEHEVHHGYLTLRCPASRHSFVVNIKNKNKTDIIFYY